MYSFSPKLRLYSIILIVLGLVLFGIGYFLNHGIDDAGVQRMLDEVHHSNVTTPTHSSEMNGPQDAAAHFETAKHQVHKKPLAAIHTAAVFFFGIIASAMFF